MPRILRKEEHDKKRNEILDAALALIYSKGYEKMTVQDVLDKLKISKGALYHYFDLKQAMLDALIDRMATDAQRALLPILHDPKLSAIQKMQGYFDAGARWKAGQKKLITSLMRMWYDEGNDLVRQKLAVQSIPQTAGMLEPVIRQGIKEKVFTTRYPEQVATLFARITVSAADDASGFVLASKPDKKTYQNLRVVLNAYIDAIERILGASPGSFDISSEDTFKEWFKASSKRPKGKR